jgi:DNA-binding response OmpR family regulator
MKKRILVVEKDDDALHMIEHILLEEGYEVFITNSEFGIFDLIKRCRPDVILLDLISVTPQATELNRAIKSEADIRHIPVIMLSSHFSLDVIRTATVDENTSKSVDVQKLLELVEN